MLGVDTLVRLHSIQRWQHKYRSNIRIPPINVLHLLNASQFGNMEGITTAVLDEFPHLRGNPLQKSLFLGALCFFFYLMGLLLVTDVSMFVFNEESDVSACFI